MKSSLVFELLNKSHVRENFSCGTDILDDYLKRRAGQELRNNLSFSYILRKEDELNVLGYYTLSATAIPTENLPEKLSKTTRYEVVPAVLIGRLAVDQSLQGQGIGQILLIDALRRITKSGTFAVLVVVVDPKDKKTKSFYEKFGFLDLKGQDDKMFIPFKTIKDI